MVHVEMTNVHVDWQTSMLKWIWRDSEGSYDDFCLWDIQVNAEYFCKILITAV